MIAYGVGFILVLRKEFSNYVYPDLAQLRKLAFILIVGLVALLPVFFINNIVVSILYKGLFFITMLFLVLPLTITAYEKEKIAEVIQRIRQGEVFIRR
jgi:energy-coupling factor transporter transmembrane protein EcfT